MTVSFVIALAVLLGLALFFFNELRRGPQNEWGRPLLWRKRVRVVLASVPLILFGVPPEIVLLTLQAQ